MMDNLPKFQQKSVYLQRLNHLVHGKAHSNYQHRNGASYHERMFLRSC
jgi:hypothetical protein